MNEKQTVEQIQATIQDNLEHVFGVSLENATDDQCYKAVALVVRNMMEKNFRTFQDKAEKTKTKHVYYLCMEFIWAVLLRTTFTT